MRLTGQLVSLGLFLADRQQRDARGGRPEHHACIGVADHGELQQMLRPTVHAGPDVEQDRRALPGGYGRGQCGPIDAGQQAEGAVGRHDGRAGMPGAEQPGRFATRHHLRGHLDSGLRLSSQRGAGRLSHVHDGVGVHEADP